MAVSPESKMRAVDRVLVLKPMEGKNARSGVGLIDPRLFRGENTLHGVMDLQTNFWSLRYEMGDVPAPLKCKFTSFSALKKHAEDYFKTRNVEIVEVRD